MDTSSDHESFNTTKTRAPPAHNSPPLDREATEVRQVSPRATPVHMAEPPSATDSEAQIEKTTSAASAGTGAPVAAQDESAEEKKEPNPRPKDAARLGPNTKEVTQSNTLDNTGAAAAAADALRIALDDSGPRSEDSVGITAGKSEIEGEKQAAEKQAAETQEMVQTRTVEEGEEALHKVSRKRRSCSWKR